MLHTLPDTVRTRRVAARAGLSTFEIVEAVARCEQTGVGEAARFILRAAHATRTDAVLHASTVRVEMTLEGVRR